MTRYLVHTVLNKTLIINVNKHSKILIAKILIILVLLVGGLGLTGCVGGTAGHIGWSGATVADGSLFVGSLGKLVALDTADGDSLWEETIETPGSSGGFGCSIPASAVAIFGNTAVVGELVYAGGYDGMVYAYTVDSGASRWVYPRSGNLGYVIIGGTVASQGRLYFSTAGGVVYALNATTGDFIWDYDEIGGDVWATPVLDGETLYIGSFNKNFYAIDATSGQAKWQQPFTTSGPIIASPVVSGNIVYIASFDRHIYALDKESGQLVWQFPVADGAGDKPDKWFWAGLVVHNGNIYAPNMDGGVYVLDADSGGLVKVIDLGGAISSTPVVVGDKVFVATEEGKIFAIDTASLQQAELKDLGVRIVAPLAAANGVIYVHTQEEETIYALDIETGAVLWDTPLDSE
jgi:outer membrane protein assembly factor BamB